MVKIPKDVGTNLIVGTFVRLSQFRKFRSGDRGRIGVCVNTEGKQVWFNDYGNEDTLAEKYEPINVGTEVTISYNEREYKRKDGTVGVTRDIKSIECTHTHTHKTLSDSDATAFMPRAAIKAGDNKKLTPIESKTSVEWRYNITQDLSVMKDVIKHIEEVLKLAEAK